MKSELVNVCCEGQAPLIMVVDDDYFTGITLDAILSTEGFRVIIAADARSCLEMIQKTTPDLILLDVVLPDESGFDLCVKLRQHQETAFVPILFISGNDNIDFKVKGFEVGAVDYITKPWRREEILARVKTHLRLRKAMQNETQLQKMRLNLLKEAHSAIFPKPEDCPEAKFSVFYQPLQEAGGDFYDVIPAGEMVYDYIVADISGHDVSTALVATALKLLLRQNCSVISTPQETLYAINRSINSILQPGQFLVATIIRVNRRSGRALIVNAGMPAPMFFSAGEKTMTSLETSGDLIGAFSDASFKMLEMRIGDGDRFFLYSDGILDLFDSGECKIDKKTSGFIEILNSVNDSSIESLPALLKQKIANLGQPGDDMVLVALEV